LPRLARTWTSSLEGISLGALSLEANSLVIPAKAGLSTDERLVIHGRRPFENQRHWIPAFAGMTASFFEASTREGMDGNGNAAQNAHAPAATLHR
jgi:hypothetical protein